MWTKDYSELTDELPAELEHFPPIDTAAVTEYANRLFKPYLFTRHDAKRRATELQCSLCGAEMTIYDELMPPEAMDAVYAGHNEGAYCPACGELVTAKHVGRLGRRKGLAEWHPLLILTERDGEIYARGYWMRKLYIGRLTAKPEFMPTSFYRFAPGLAEIYEAYYGHIAQKGLTGDYNPARRVITEPFTTGGYMGGWEPYAVYGMEEVERSFARYCGRETTCPGYLVEWGAECVRVQRDLCKFLALCCIYPRQIEMLNKTGFAELVDDLVCGRKKNAKIFNWNAESYKDAFGLTKQEMQQWRSSGAPVQAIADYKSLRRVGQHPDFATLRVLHQLYFDTNGLIKLARRYGIETAELHKYLCKQARENMGENSMYGLLADYYNMAEELNWQLGSPAAPLLPRDLVEKHDEAAEEQRILRRRRAAAEEKKRAEEAEERRREAEESFQKRREKYNVERAGYLIRIAETEEEIEREGDTLRHCVGDYAQRHVAGKLTICFIRRTETPDASLYTVEMQDNRLIQIHGYKNDVNLPWDKKPEAVMAWLLEPWIEWLKRGSPRDETGAPKWPKTKKKEKNAA